MTKLEIENGRIQRNLFGNGGIVEIKNGVWKWSVEERKGV
ncbi:hypothetical protein KSS87_003934 [Heliosperma pusillum]|nr:hypothetical protein KSS87_008388 [Heliosperma pusillum]KAH9610002.1 hypothetical protein KSS87_015157 [Heliosperma pusillum]KAH9613433.1 hypothetical protein KSS87_004173 [Heliosperma pusillum]KAH9616252.1 hypothetical protein KSS87_003934 [Heliosperma pusillum]